MLLVIMPWLVNGDEKLAYLQSLVPLVTLWEYINKCFKSNIFSLALFGSLLNRVSLSLSVQRSNLQEKDKMAFNISVVCLLLYSIKIT